MQIVIEIPENILNMVCNTGTYGCYRFNSTKAIKNGVPLDKVIEDIKAEIEDLRNKCMEQGGVYEHTAYGSDYATVIINKHIEKENTDADSD